MYLKNDEMYLKENLYVCDLEGKKSDSGIPIIFESNKVYTTNPLNNTLIVSTDNDETTKILSSSIKNYSSVEKSMIIYDEFGSLYENTHSKLEKENYKVINVDYSDKECLLKYNPLSIAYAFYKNDDLESTISFIGVIGNYLIGKESENEDPFWTNSARTLFTGVVLYIFEKYKEKDATFANIYDMINNFDNKEFCIIISNDISKSDNCFYYLNQIINMPNDTKNAVIAVCLQQLNENVEMWKLNEIIEENSSLFDLIKQKYAIFLTGNNNTARKFIPLYIDFLISLINLYNVNIKTTIIISNLYKINKIQEFDKKLSQLNNNLTYVVVANSFKSLYLRYGKENFEIIKLCFNDLLYLYANDFETLNEISKLCSSDSKNKTVTIDELRTLKKEEILLILSRMHPSITKVNYL